MTDEKGFSFILASGPDREEVVLEMYYDGEDVAELRFEPDEEGPSLSRHLYEG